VELVQADLLTPLQQRLQQEVHLVVSNSTHHLAAAASMHAPLMLAGTARTL
jgi:hypothetical protein